METKEIRISKIHIEERASSEGTKKPKMVGYAALFDTDTKIGGYFIERIAPGAFTNALKNSDVHALFNHDESDVLGRMKSGTLILTEDDKGLLAEIDPPNTDDANDLIELMKRGDVDQMSFAFTMQGGKEEWDETGNVPIRTLIEIGELYDVSVVTRGAYPQTSVGLRSLEAFRAQKQPKFCSKALSLRAKIDLDLRGRNVR